MRIHEIKLTYKFKKIKRIGRGGKRGTYSGKGQKGQSARAGHRIRPAERDVIQRLPKLRGVKFKSLSVKPAVVNLSDLEKKMKDNIITIESLVKNGLIKNGTKNVKILAGGNVGKPFDVKGVAVSGEARKKIEAAGGKILDPKV